MSQDLTDFLCQSLVLWTVGDKCLNNCKNITKWEFFLVNNVRGINRPIGLPLLRLGLGQGRKVVEVERSPAVVLAGGRWIGKK